MAARDYRFEITCDAGTYLGGVSIKRWLDHNEATYGSTLPYDQTIAGNLDTAPAGMLAYTSPGVTVPGLRVRIYDADNNVLADSTQFTSSNGYVQVAFTNAPFYATDVVQQF